MNKTPIEWTDYSSNPLRTYDAETGKRGWFCTHASPGCENCYSERLNLRLGNGLTYTAQNRKRVRWDLDEREFEAWKRLKPGERVFVCDMTDLFHEDVPDEIINQVFRAMGASQGTFQVLTKRAERLADYFANPNHFLYGTVWIAPNDYIELGTHAEAIGEMGYIDMLGRFFKNEKTGLHGASIYGAPKWRFRGHAEHDFWRWVCSWARALRKPSDLGFEDGAFILPPLTHTEHVAEARTVAAGRLFNTLALTREEQLEERRRTLPERCEKAAELLAAHDGPAIGWCHLNPEGDLITRLVPGAVQVTGSDSDERKEEVFMAFARGEVRKLVSKPSIAGFGMNWQHCAHMTMFPSHSFEQYYQCIRRCWRFGQQNPVQVDLITSEGEASVLANLQRKASQAEAMFARLIALMHDTLEIERRDPYQGKAEAPAWL